MHDTFVMLVYIVLGSLIYPFSLQMRRKSGWKWMYKTGGYQADTNGQRLAVVCLQLTDTITGWYIVILTSMWSLCAFLKNWVADPAFCKGGFIGLLVFFIHHCKWLTEVQCLQCCIEALHVWSLCSVSSTEKEKDSYVCNIIRKSSHI